MNAPAAISVSHKRTQTEGRKNFDLVSVCAKLRLNKATQSPGFAFHNDPFLSFFLS